MGYFRNGVKISRFSFWEKLQRDIARDNYIDKNELSNAKALLSEGQTIKIKRENSENWNLYRINK